MRGSGVDGSDIDDDMIGTERFAEPQRPRQAPGDVDVAVSTSHHQLRAQHVERRRHQDDEGARITRTGLSNNAVRYIADHPPAGSLSTARGSNVSLPAPLGPTMRNNRAGPRPFGSALSCPSARRSGDALTRAPDRAYDWHRRLVVDAHQIATPANRDLAPIVQADHLRRRLGHGADRRC